MAEEKRNDPSTKAVRESEASGIRPGFLGGSGGGDAPEGLKDDKKKKAEENAEAAQNELSNAENEAGEANTNEGGFYRPGSGISNARKEEEKANGFYAGSGRGENEKKDNKKGFKGLLKKGGPVTAIILGIFGVGGLMGVTQIFQPFSLVAQFTETFNSMHTSANMRSNAFYRWQMDSGRTKEPIKGRIFGKDKFKISDTQATKLAAQGIDYDDDFGGSGVRVMKFIDSDGNGHVIVADPSDIDTITARVSTDSNSFDFGGEGVTYVQTFKDLYATDIDFFNKYNAGSMTWRGAVANWFGSLTEFFLGTNNLTRNAFDDFQDKVAENGGDTKATVQKILSTRTDEIEGGGFRSSEGVDKQEVDEDGEPVYVETGVEEVVPDDADANSQYKANGKEVLEVEGKTSIKDMNINARLNSIAGSVQKGANIACTVGNVVGAVGLLVTAAEALQIINLTTAYFETVDKVKAGDGDNAPIHVLTNALNESQINENAKLEFTDYGGEKDSVENINESGIQALKVEYEATNKTAMQSSGIAALYGGGAVDPNNPSVSSFNFSNNIKRILGGIGVSMAGFGTCAIAKIVANGVSAVTDAAKIVACIAGAIGAFWTAGLTAVAGCSGLAVGVAKSIAISVAIGVTVAAVIATITPLVSQALTRDIISNLGGEDLGNALTSGANMYLGNNHRANGGSLATTEKYTEFALAQQQVIAENAKYERSALSPFDLTSKYTFMGTLMTQMMSFLTTDSLMSTITTSSSVVSASIVALSPTASAYDVAATLPDMEEYDDTCPYLASIGAVGDAYCNPYSVTDMSTMEKDPVDVINHLAEGNSFLDEETSDGNVIINQKSDLAKYILFCDNRESAFGIADNNIVSAVSSWGNVRTESSAVNTVSNSAIGAIPVVGDIIDVGSNAQALANVGYVSGESCVAGNNVENADVPEWNDSGSPTWSAAKYYQRFIEDQALAESMGLVEKSAVAVLLDEYYEQNPLDNSYEGILARKSGLSKDTVVAILDLVEYGNYIANYHPEERYAFGASVVKLEDKPEFDNENVLAGDVVLMNVISFADVRNRTFAV